MNKIVQYFLIFLTIFAVAVIAYMATDFSSGKEDIAASLKWKHQAQFAGMYVADDKRFYDKSGLQVTLKEFNFDKDPIDELMDGSSQFALMSAEEFLLHVDEGKNIKAVAAFYQTSPYSIISLKQSGVATPADFVGKTLGIKGGKIEEELFYLLLLNRFGITRDQVDLKTLGFAKRELDDLIDEDADAVDLYRTDQLYFFEQENIDYNIILPELFGININNDILVTTNDFMEKNPDVVNNFVKSTIKGWEYAINHPDEAVDITLKYVIDENYKDRQHEEYILENSIPLIQPSTGQQIGFIRPAAFESLYRVMLDNNFLKTTFEVSDHYTNNFIH